MDLLAALEHLRLKCVHIMCFGDFGQLPPVSNRWRGCGVPATAFENSDLFLNWSEATRFVLKRCWRSDQTHFDFYTGLQGMRIREALAAARARYPARAEDSTWNITMSNFRRKKINQRLQRKAAAGQSEKILIDGEDAEVHYHLFVGTRLISANTVGKFVIGITPEGISLQDEETKECFEASVEQIAKHTELRWALTLCAVQGKSLDGTIAIHDTGSVHFNIKHLYVALSRATDGANVSIATCR